jgi:hypothetical protein
MTCINPARIRSLCRSRRRAFDQPFLTKIKDCGCAIATLQWFELSGEPR